MRKALPTWYTPIITTVLSGLILMAVPAIWSQGKAICKSTNSFASLARTVKKQGEIIELHNKQILQLQLRTNIQPLTVEHKPQSKNDTL